MIHVMKQESGLGARVTEATERLVRKGLPAHGLYMEGYPTDGGTEWRAAVDEAMAGCGDLPVESYRWRYCNEAVVQWFGGVLLIERRNKNNVKVTGVCEHVDKVDRLAERLKRCLTQRSEERGSVFVLTQSMRGFQLTSAGVVHTAFEPANYLPAAARDYEHVLACLNSSEPCGRLVVFDGPPGTGKSFMVRALASAADATFVVVASSLVGRISGPEIMPVLLGVREDDERRPIVLVMEDADDVLVRREAADRVGLSELLNLGDGILGELADVRVIATTNAERVRLDPAVVRAGRMCRHVPFRPLGHDGAAEVYHRLVGEGAAGRGFANDATLADAYRAARQDGWVPAAKGSVPGQYL